ncbi:MAG: D-alanyl-D-alanine carboxypeptidase/D-alanyl-D-alanine-endopeptidase [Gammaproteobacteria bacterium]|nr:D-alanyl-D-alanine carboxypeptidase/D-alanyl-D-alanine-endopeptidase [Gammaproteobacteria bacterium]
MSFLFSTLLLSGAAVADLQSDIDAIIDSPKSPAALWGIRIEESDSDRVLYSRNGDLPFVPASVAKIVSTAVALDRLGPDYTFTTHLQFPVKAIPKDGVIRGDLQIIGGGDPTFGTPEGATGRKVLHKWAKRLAKEGVKKINGHIVGVDDIFIEEPLGQGGAWDDEQYHFSAESSGLTIHGGAAGYRIDGNKKQRLKKKQIHLYPKSDYLKPHVRVTDEKRQVKITRRRGTNHFVVEVPESMKRNPAMSGKVTVKNPTEWSVTLFKQALEEAGIEVSGKAVDSDYLRGFEPATGLVWSHHSKPLKEILPLANKRSINLVAEHLLRMSGLQRNQQGEITRPGSVTGGLQRVAQLFKRLGIKPYRYKMVDGSGLSRYNLFRPEDLVTLLKGMEAHPQAEVYRDSLSQSGKDGTLTWRFRETPLEGKVWAKTGTLSSIRAIAGHLKTPKGKWLTFTVMVNNYASGSRKIRNRMDKILLKAAEWADKKQPKKETKKKSKKTVKQKEK